MTPSRVTDGTLSNNAYSSEEYLKITEEQLKASAAAQQDIASSPPESQVEIGSQSQDSNPPNSEDYLKVTGEQLDASAATQLDVASSPPESQFEVESQPQGAVQETAVAAPSVQKPETET